MNILIVEDDNLIADSIAMPWKMKAIFIKLLTQPKMA